MYINKNEIASSRKRLLQYKQQLDSLSALQYETAIGLCLGDASLQSQSKHKTNYRMKFEWKQKEYAFHIYDVFSEWILSPPRLRVRTNRVSGKTNQTRQFQTISHSAFYALATLFLNEKGKKRIVANIIQDHLTARGLAYWYMDDGGMADKGRYATNLHTQGFEAHEVHMLCKEMSAKFACACWPKRNKRKYCIVISGHDYQSFKNRIEPWVIPSMQYKLPPRA